MTKNVLKRGLVQVYTGTGKGKTTAAFGLTWRMLGRGGNVYVFQFLKPADIETGEANLARLISAGTNSRLTLSRADYCWNMAKSHDASQRELTAHKIHDALRQVRQILISGDHDLVILDEILVCYSMKLVSLSDIAALVEQKAEHTELVLTGRGADDQIFQLADLVTRFEEVKHPFNSGVQARAGVDF